MIEFALLGASYFGLPYFAAVGIEYALLRFFWRTKFQPNVADFGLVIPVFLYLILHRMEDRQGFFLYRAILITTAVVCVTMPIKALVPKHGVVAILVVIIVGCVAATTSWHYLATSGDDMFKNAPGVW